MAQVRSAVYARTAEPATQLLPRRNLAIGR